MGRGRAFAAAVLAWAAMLVGPTRADADGPGAPAAPATQHLESADGRVAIDFPDGWKVESDTVDSKAALSMHARVPPGNDSVHLSVFHVPGFRNERAQAYYEREKYPALYGVTTRGDVVLAPTPHVVMEFPGHDLTLRVWIYRVIDRNGFTLYVNCRTETWPTIRDACFRAAQSLTSRIEEWPARPEGFKASERDGYEYLVQPGVKDADVAALHAAALDLEKRYAKTHGPVPKPRDDRPVIVLCADKRGMNRLTNEQSGDHAYQADTMEGRLLATPLRKDDAAARGEFAEELTAIFHAQLYGYGGSEWLCDGERRLARAEAIAGKPLPSCPESFQAQLPTAVVTFETLIAKSTRDERWEQIVPYVALFHAGPRVYRDAFAAFLEAYAANGDEAAAEKQFLLSLDQEKLRAAALDFVRSGLKPVKTTK